MTDADRRSGMQTLYIKNSEWSEEGSWRLLCTVHDNIALGFLIRLLASQGFEAKVEAMPIPGERS